MPEENPEQSAELAQLADDIQADRDRVVVPEELVVEPEEKLTAPVRRSLQMKIQDMKSGERLKLALRGNREARTILIRDTSLMIRRYVLLNPRVSEDEVVQLARNRQVDRDLLEIICRNSEWLNNYQVRLALVQNPKTPVGISMKFIGTLMVRDLRRMAKSKNIPTTINSAAKRIILRGTLR